MVTSDMVAAQYANARRDMQYITKLVAAGATVGELPKPTRGETDLREVLLPPRQHKKMLSAPGFTEEQHTLYSYKHTGAINLY